MKIPHHIHCLLYFIENPQGLATKGGCRSPIKNHVESDKPDGLIIRLFNGFDSYSLFGKLNISTNSETAMYNVGSDNDACQLHDDVDDDNGDDDALVNCMIMLTMMLVMMRLVNCMIMLMCKPP